MKFLIAGLGSAGRRHLRNLVALGERDVVLLRSGRSTLPDDELSGWPVERDLETALRREPDAVIVATPTSLHLDVAIPAANAGCHLLLEKPVSHDFERVDLLETAVAGAGGRVLVGFQFRFHPLLERVRTLVQSGSLGRVLWAQAHWGQYLPAWHPWEDYKGSYAARADLGGGVLLTLCHPIDYLLWTLGPLDCSAARIESKRGLNIGVDDYVDLWLTGSSGLSASVHLNYYEDPTQHWLAVGGDRGSLRLDFVSDRLTGTVGGEAIDERPAGGFERNTLFRAEMQHFLDVVHGRSAPRCSLDDGLGSLRIIWKARDIGAPTGGRR